MIKLIVIGLLLSTVSCAKRKHIRALDGRVSQLEIEREQLSNEVLDHEARLKALESINHLNESDVRGLFSAQLSEIEAKILSAEGQLSAHTTELGRLEGLINTTNEALSTLEILSESDVLALIQGQVTSITNQITNQEISIEEIKTSIFNLTTEVTNLEDRLNQNDLFVNMPTCEHSFGVVYDPNGNIKTVFITENVGTVAGSWELNNNSTYNLQIDGVVTCTGVRYNKNDKALYFNDINGLAQVVDLSY